MECNIKCGGKCCQVITFGKNHAELERFKKSDFFKKSQNKDLKTVFNMLEPITMQEAYDFDKEAFKSTLVHHGIFYSDSLSEKEFEEICATTIKKYDHGHLTHLRQVYKCKNLTEDGECGIYEDRPEMCKTFPGEHKCQFCGVINEPRQQAKKEEYDRLRKKYGSDCAKAQD